VRYLLDGARMWRRLASLHPQAIIVVSPPVIAPLVAWAWCRRRHCRLVVDCHTGALHGWKWRWSRGLHRLLFRRATTVLVHTEEDERLVKRWGSPVLLLPDDLPDARQAAAQAQAKGPCVVVAGSLDANEPVATVLSAARLLPQVEFRFTGDPRRVPASVRAKAPPNAIFTGFLSYPTFLGELLGAHVVAVFSTDPHIMNRAAFEAIGLSRPLVLSDLTGLRTRFGEAALFAANTPQAMADELERALHRRHELAEKSAALQVRLRAQHHRAMAMLNTNLSLPVGAP
jgi:hypothetical protein